MQDGIGIYTFTNTMSIRVFCLMSGEWSHGVGRCMLFIIYYIILFQHFLLRLLLRATERFDHDYW
jgi:hypothetical protein